MPITADVALQIEPRWGPCRPTEGIVGRQKFACQILIYCTELRQILLDMPCAIFRLKSDLQPKYRLNSWKQFHICFVNGTYCNPCSEQFVQFKVDSVLKF